MIDIQKYTEKYILTIVEYIEKSGFLQPPLSQNVYNTTTIQSDIHNNATILPNTTNILDNKSFLIEIGFRAITYVFQINFIISKDLDTAYYSCKKAYLYYLEYLEQIHTTNMVQNLNHINAILFVYKKSIIHYSNNKLPTSINHLKSYGFENKCMKISKLMNVLLWWNNNEIIRNQIMILFSFKYINTFLDFSEEKSENIENTEKSENSANSENIYIYIENLQKKKINHDEYCQLLQKTLIEHTQIKNTFLILDTLHI
jgi:hypothetical protein